MKKSLIALAVAGVVAAPAASFAATANVDFYGKLRISLDHLDQSIGWQMNDETSRIGFKGAEDLGGGLKAIYQWETGVNIGTNAPQVASTGASGTDSAGGLAGGRNTYVGLSGDFGTVLAGRHDTPYKILGSADMFGDTLADATNASYAPKAGGMSTLANKSGRCIICEDIRVDNAIAYVSPKFSGFSAVGAIVPGGVSGHNGIKSISNAYSLAGMYNNGPLSAGVAYENLGQYTNVIAGTTGVKQKAVKLNASYTIDALKFGGTYEVIKNNAGISDAKSRNYLLSAAYGMGPITLAAQYGKRNENGTAGNHDLAETALGVVYGLSKRTSTYVGYAHYKQSGADSAKVNALTVGLNHDF
jgi:predicted porin